MRCGWASTNLLPAPSGFRSRQPWSSRHPVREGNCLQFSALADLRREMSTKSNNNAAAVGACFGVGNLAPENQFVKRAQMELAYFSFYARLKQRQTGGAGVVLRVQRVPPRRLGGFHALPGQGTSTGCLDSIVPA